MDCFRRKVANGIGWFDWKPAHSTVHCIIYPLGNHINLTDNPTLGADPELFLANPKGIYCPWDILPEPKRPGFFVSGGHMNRDGMALELNPQHSSRSSVVGENIASLLSALGRLSLQKSLTIIKSLGCDISSLPDRDLFPYDVFELGCHPDINAYTEHFNEVQVNPEEFPERYAGGHIHIQVGNLDQSEACELVKLFDVHAGLPSVLFGDDVWSPKRRQVYGKAGDFRHNLDEGIIEYRTPDAGWLWVNKGFEILADGMLTAFSQFKAGNRVTKDYIANIRGAINACDKSYAHS